MNAKNQLFEQVSQLGAAEDTCCTVSFGLLLIELGELVVERDRWCRGVAPLLFEAIDRLSATQESSQAA